MTHSAGDVAADASGMLAATGTRVLARRAAAHAACAAGAAAVVAAAVSFARAPHSASALAGLAGVLAATALAERFPLPVEESGAPGVTLSFVFAVAAIQLFGWPAGVLVGAGGPTLARLAARRQRPRALSEGSAFALSALAAGLASDAIGGDSIVALCARLAACALLYGGVSTVLLRAVTLAAGAERPLRALVAGDLRRTAAPLALMTSAALILVVLWQRSPALSFALVGPLVAIALYQRSTSRALGAMRLALTDPLTGLGNQRHFHERLQRELAAAEQQRTRISLCLVDVDDFKRVNDRFGHPVGDRVLAQVASRLRQGGESFRLGGDEFAVLLPGVAEAEAAATAHSIVERVAAIEVEHLGSLTVSAGVASHPVSGAGRDELIRRADSALYWAKEDGKNRVRSYGVTPFELGGLRDPSATGDRAARYRAAASLAKAVDARDAYTGSHSERVGELAARTARRLGLGGDRVELVRLAARLHDLGKLAIPEEILRKPERLSTSERLVLERHPQIGYRMLESLDVDPVADCVLHHHERWDGAGYPDGLRGEEIPLGARVIFVADAFDAMTSMRVYGKPLSPPDALAELERCAGTQFDPEVVAAFVAELGARDGAAALVVS